MLLITLRVDPGYHINANPATSDNLIPTSVAFSGAAPEQIAYPPPSRFKTRFADDELDVYEGTVVITATFSAGGARSHARPQLDGDGASLHGGSLPAAGRHSSACDVVTRCSLCKGSRSRAARPLSSDVSIGAGQIRVEAACLVA